MRPHTMESFDKNGFKDFFMCLCDFLNIGTSPEYWTMQSVQEQGAQNRLLSEILKRIPESRKNCEEAL